MSSMTCLPIFGTMHYAVYFVKDGIKDFILRLAYVANICYANSYKPVCIKNTAIRIFVILMTRTKDSKLANFSHLIKAVW